MKVFISWSGDRSRKLAEFLAGWLRKLPLTIVPWVSKEAIDPGTRWGKELAEALEGTSFGILCVTPENQKEPWVNFEAGALSKTIEKTYVVPYLIGMKPSELEQPLKQFQASEADEEGTWKLIETIYMASGDKTRTIADLKEAFGMWWEKLKEEIKKIESESLESDTIKPEPKLSDIKNNIDKVLTVLESVSSRLSKVEASNLPSFGEIMKNQLIDSLITKSSKQPRGLGLVDYVKIYYDIDKKEIEEKELLRKYYEWVSKQKDDKSIDEESK